MKYTLRLAIVVFVVFQVGCTKDTTSPPSADQPTVSWKRMKLYDSLSIALPSTYDSVGYFRGDDTYGFHNWRNDGRVDIRFEVGPGTPYVPRTFAVLPDTNRYAWRDTFSVHSNYQGAFYYGMSSEPYRDRIGVAVLENAQRTEFIEILFVSYSSVDSVEVMTILRTIRYE